MNSAADIFPPVEGASQHASEMAALIEAKDWSATPVGPAENWSASLKMMLSVMLANRFPLLLWWGPEYVQFYNDAYRPIPGAKHPSCLGQSARECWPEIWHILKPLVDTPFQGGPSTWIEDLELHIRRAVFREETHFTVAYSPVPDPTVPGGIGGVLATVHEITEKVIGERRLALLRELAARASEGRTGEEACTIAAETLAKDPQDLPFSALYLLDADRTIAHLAGATGVNNGKAISPLSFELSEQSASLWSRAAARAVRRNAIEQVEDLVSEFKNVPRGPWGDLSSRAVVVPIPATKPGDVRGILLHGVSERLALDDNYRTFFQLIAAQVATAISNAEAHEEERRRAEALAEIDRAKTVFFSNVSHEFRTPLTLMLGPLEDLLARGDAHLSPTATEQLELVNRNGARLLRLVNTLLDFSRIEAGRMQAVYEATDLAQFTAELAGVFRSATETAGLRLVVNISDLGEPVYVDRDMWEKIVLNLISNAFKFTFEGEIEVSVQRVGERAQLRVRDTGVGIPADQLPRVFERFHRIPNVRSRTHEGSGIGLALVHELIKLHGGSIRVGSTEGKGTVFIVEVPFRREGQPTEQTGGSRGISPAAAAKPFVEEALRWLPHAASMSEAEVKAEEIPMTVFPVNRPATSRARVLIADDNADMRNYLARLLSEQFEVEAVGHGRAALDIARKRPPDLILSDVMMPVQDGFELLKAIRADEKTRRIPVVLLSARAGEESRVEGLQSGADDYVIKPFTARELLARVSARLEISRLQGESEERIAADLKDMTRLYEVGKLCARTEQDVETCLREIVATAIEVTRAEKGNLQLLDPETGVLTIAAQKGFEGPFLNYFKSVHDNDSACGKAVSAGRVVVPDVRQSDIFAGKRSLAVLLEAGVRAVQSTPLVSSSGRLLGILSTHFPQPHQLAERELRLMDLLARQAADYLERKQVERTLQDDITALREAKEELRKSQEELQRAHNALEFRVQERTRDLTEALQKLKEEVALRKEKEERLHELSTRLLRMQDEERRRIARELHDSAGQTLAALKMVLANLEQQAQATRYDPTQFHDANELTDSALREVRTTSHLLHPPLLDESGLASAVSWYVEEFQKRSKIQVSIAAERIEMPKDTELVLFRVLQESLTNVLRHSGASSAEVKLEDQGAFVQLSIRDSGRGIDRELLENFRRNGTGVGVGMAGMRERVRERGGELEVSGDSSGTLVRVRVRKEQVRSAA